jgi:TP901 family phage tail tape measure protein
MAQQFNLTAQINLQSPKNVGRVVSDIQRQLKGSGLNTVNLKVKADPRSMAQTNRQLQNVSKNSKAAARDIGNLNRNLQEATRRFSVITLATGTLLSFVTGFKNATKAAIEFERELIKISQVTGKSVSQLSDLTKEVTRLSTSLGASSADLLGVSRTLAQAGFSAEQTRKALDILAKTSLGATFSSIQDTTEGAIALLRQFGKEARSAGGDIKFLEQSLDAINAVSKRFAVESDDLITVIRRVGGVFSTAGGEVNELIALFTSVRSTTRESAETIATGLRTIFTRIQRPETIAQLKELGIQLQDAQGNFVGAFEAVKRLSEGLGTLDPRSAVFSQIVEDLGGFRQIGKVIPLIQQFATAQQALAVAQAGSGSVARDAQKAQAGLGVEIQKVKEEFAALIRQFADSSTFQSVARGALEIARAMIKVAEAVEPLLPLLTSLFALKLGRSLAPGLASLAGVARGGRGGGGAGFSRFARGGMVPGSGNRDTVPAMLTPGEFVIKKSSVKSLGADTLTRMNNNRYQDAGKVAKDKTALGKLRGGEEINLAPSKLGIFKKALLRKAGDKDGDTELDIAGAFLQPQGVIQSLRSDIQGKEILQAAAAKVGGTQKEAQAFLKAARTRGGQFTIPMSIKSGSLSKRVSSRFRAGISRSLGRFSQDFASKEVSGIKFNRSKFRTAYKSSNIEQIEGGIFESFLNGLSDKPFDNQKINPNDVFDFRGGLGAAAKAFDGIDANRVADAKRTFSTDALASLTKKGGNLILENITGQLAKSLLEKGPSKAAAVQERRAKLAAGDQLVANRTIQTRKAAGGRAPSDTVPALLTPGEFVFSKSSAQSIGYGNLSKMNQQGVQGFAKGGPVGGARFSPTQALAGSGMISSKNLQAATKQMSVFEKILAKLNQIARQLEATFKKADTTVKRTDGDLQKMDVDIKDVAIQLDKEAQEIKESNAARDKEQAALNRSASARAQKVGGALQSGAGVVSRGASAAQSAAGTAQSLLFLGAMIGSVTSQMSGLDKATKTAINQTTTMVAVVGGITGTLVDIGASFVLMGAAAVNSIGSMISQAGASAVAGTADLGEAAATGTATAALGPFAIAAIAVTVPLVLAAAAAAAFAGTLYYFSSKAKAEADEFGKAADKFIQTFRETGQGLSDVIQNVAKQEAAEEESRALFAQLGTLAAVLPDIGGIRDSAFSLVGATPQERDAAKAAADDNFNFVSMLFDAQDAIEKTQQESTAAFNAQLEKNTEALNQQLLAQQKLILSMKTFETELNDIDLAEALEPEERVSQRLQAQQDFAARTPGGQQQFDELFANIRKAQQDAFMGAVRQDSEQDLSFLDIRSGGQFANIEALNNLSKEQLELIPPTLRKALQTSLESLNTALDASAKNTAESLKTLSEARQNIDISDTRIQSFADLGRSSQLQGLDPKVAKANEDYIAAIEASKTAIRNESILREAQLKQQLRAAKTDEDRDQLQAAIDAEVDRRDKLIKNIDKGEENAFKSSKDRRDADIAAAEAAQLLRIQLFEAAQALESFKERTQSFVDDRLAIEDQAGIAQGRGSKLTATRLQGITATSDLGQFRADAQAAISGISDRGQRDQAQKAIDQQIAAGEALQKAADPSSGLLNRRSAQVFAAREGSLDNLTKVIEKEFGDVIPDLSFLPKEVQEQIIRGIAEAAGGGISQEGLDKILKPVQESAAANKEITDEIVKGNQEYLNAFTSYLNEVKRQYEEEVKFRDSVFQQQEQAIDREIRARNIINQSLGRDAVVQDRNAKEARRVQKAQADLTAAGVGVGAGDIAGLTGERQRLAGLAQAQGDQIRGATDDATRTAVAKEQSETLRQLAAVNKELERLANQSGRVDDMFAEMERNAEAIEKERAKREAVTAVVEEFVIGGQDTRQALVEAANGVRKAFATGTLQNQTPEQRQATVGFLDKLADVELLGGFTGREIKQELVFRDAIRMGLDPRIAEQLATATSTEEKLIQANELLAFEINQLSAEMRAAQQGLNPANVAQAPVAPPLARGGLIYRANGGSIFQPKGTDTVPAMLTPGEFVIRKSAVDAIGTDTLAAINSGASYFNNGGSVDKYRPRRDDSAVARLASSGFTFSGFDSRGDEIWTNYTGLKRRLESVSSLNKKKISRAQSGASRFDKGLKVRANLPVEQATYEKKDAQVQEFNRQRIAQQSIDESMAFGLGESFGATFRGEGSENTTARTAQEFLARDKFLKKQAINRTFDKSKVSSSAFMELTRAMTKQNTATLSPKDYQNIRKKFSSLSNEEFDKEYKSLQKIMRQRLEKQALEEFSGSAGSGLEDFPLDGFDEMEQEAKREYEAKAGEREALKMIGGVISKAGSIASVVGSKIAEARKEQMEQAKQRARDRRFGDKTGRNTAAGRRAARLAGIKSKLSGSTVDPNQARYDRILRTQGPAAAQRFATSQGFTPSGGMGAGTGRGITQAFRNRPNMMGSPEAMQQFQQFQQYQQFLKFQQQQQFRGGIRFRAAGGGISGSDTVPAMLTPGEFVMSAGAVRQHGIGTMRALNRGQIKGFNRGGLVGGTQYLQNGGQATGGVDLTKISETFDKITSSINKLSTNLESLNERFGYFEMQHTVMVDGQINLPGIDSSAIAQEITDSIGGLVADEVKKALDNPEARP